jgi:hypothetical protein
MITNKIIYPLEQNDKRQAHKTYTTLKVDETHRS